MDRRLLAGTGAGALVAAAVLALGGASADVGTVDLAGSLASAPPATPPAPATTTAASEPTTTPAATAAPTPPAAPPPTAAPTPSPPPPTPAVTIPTTSARLSDVRLAPAPAPTRLAMPSIGVDVPVAALGIDADGQMAIPDDVGEAGWYRFGPTPGDAGNAVIAGHVDSRTQGLGAFHALVDLAVGDVVTVTAADGSSKDFEVTGREEVDKDVLAADELFRRDGPVQLVLVTCGGDFDADAGSYRSNVVVVAKPV